MVLKEKSQEWLKKFEWGYLTFSLKKCQSIVKLIKSLLRKRSLKMHGPKSKFIMKAVRVWKQESFEKKREDFED